MLNFGKQLSPWSQPVFATSSPRPLKRRRESNAAITSQPATISPALKQPRTSDDDNDRDRPTPLKKAKPSPVTEAGASLSTSPKPDMERARDAIEQQFSLEILLKHDELRLINQELAKCQVALEQLRRCHLIPYPVNVPTPEQMLNITNGSGPALQPKLGDKLPQWAPPFGVTDGPYARHYAKWLIPDPKFDGIQPGILAHSSDGTRLRTSMDGRSTRNSFTDFTASQSKGRPVRGTAGQKLQSLSSGYAPPKDKNGPCVLKRSDGKTVKLVCIDCHRENFSSTQGFINHCRIAHKRDFKSHEEAAVHCGHEIEVTDNGGIVGEEKPGTHSALPSGLVHPFVHANAMAESEACFSVVRRIQQSMELYKKGQLPGNASSPVSQAASRPRPVVKPPPTFSASPDSPHLSRLLQSRGFNGNLGASLSDAKTKVDLAQFSSLDDDEEEDGDTSGVVDASSTGDQAQSHAVRMRVPARATMSPAVSIARPSSSKGPTPLAPYATPVPTPTPRVASGPEPEILMDADMLDRADLSPNTAVSNNAPSLVSDDGEYDDSADSDSEMGDSIGAQSLSTVDEVDLEMDHPGAQGLRHHGSSGAGAETTVRFGEDDSKHVTFVGPVKNKGNGKK
ncbi:Uu.00g104160.m01.CDS01 [Anthostomella pinea]|uniref:Uu.00g104160.m01.CDS01 n=1 Tax=Anthostomella pinea TaxID=933095 RepID=A0AAI8VEQ1_9PEZI|nr:Uu.00g104160.m01.CDS01 [Anthostomella pinea]